MDLRYRLLYCTTGDDGVRDTLSAALLSAPDAQLTVRIYRKMRYRPATPDELLLERPADLTDAAHMVVLDDQTRFGHLRDCRFHTEAEAIDAAREWHASLAGAQPANTTPAKPLMP